PHAVGHRRWHHGNGLVLAAVQVVAADASGDQAERDEDVAGDRGAGGAVLECAQVGEVGGAGGRVAVDRALQVFVVRPPGEPDDERQRTGGDEGDADGAVVVAGRRGRLAGRGQAGWGERAAGTAWLDGRRLGRV